MRKIFCCVALLAVSLAHAGDSPIRWKHAPGSENTDITFTTTAIATADSILLYDDAVVYDSGGLTWHQPNTVVAPAAVRFARGVAICPHCEHEYDSKAGYHTIIMSGTEGDFETCVDNVISLLRQRLLGKFLSDDD